MASLWYAAEPRSLFLHVDDPSRLEGDLMLVAQLLRLESGDVIWNRLLCVRRPKLFLQSDYLGVPQRAEGFHGSS